MTRLPAEPSGHRVWQELRKVGVLSLGQGIWAAPDYADRVFHVLHSPDGTPS